MSKKYLNTLFAATLLAALYGSFKFYERRKSQEPPKLETSPVEKLLSLDPAHITSVSLSPRGEEAFTCARTGGKWAIETPKKLAADQVAVTSLVNSLTSASIDEVADPHPANPKDFGLDPPAEAIEVTTDANPARVTLKLGDETPTGGGVYAQVPGNPRVVTLAGYLKSSLEKKLFDLRDHRAVTLEADQIQRIEAESKGKKWVLEKNPEGVWDLVLPPAVRADRYTVEGMMGELRSLSMQSILGEDKKNPAKYGLNAPTLRVKLTSAAGTQTLIAGKKDGDRYDAMNSALEPVFTLNSSLLTQFQKDPADLRDKDLFSYSSFEVKSVELETPKGKRAFEKQKDKWKQTAPAARDLASDKVETVLDRLRDLRAVSFPKGRDLASSGLAHPAYRFRVRFGDRNQEEVVEAAKVGDHVYARRSTDPLPAELSKDALDLVEKAIGEL